MMVFTQEGARRALAAFEADLAALREEENQKLIYGALPDDEIPFWPRTPGERAAERLAAKDPRERERRRLLSAGRDGGA